MSDSLWPYGLYSLWNSLGQNTRVGSPSLLQEIFLSQELNPGLLPCRWILYQLSHKWSPIILEWVAYPFSSAGKPKNRVTPFVKYFPYCSSLDPNLHCLCGRPVFFLTWCWWNCWGSSGLNQAQFYLSSGCILCLGLLCVPSSFLRSRRSTWCSSHGDGRSVKWQDPLYKYISSLFQHLIH